MRLRRLFFILFVLGGAACRAPDASLTSAEAEKQKLANEIRRKAASHIKQETELRPMGTIGQMLHDVQKLGLSFSYYKPVDIAEGRKLLVYAVNAILKEVNQEEKPVFGAIIDIYNDNFYGYTVSDKDGNYSMLSVPEGDYQITAINQGFWL